MARVGPVMKTFNKRKSVRTASDSGLILPAEHRLSTLVDTSGNMGLSGNPYNPGEARHTIPKLIAERYLAHCDDTGMRPSDDARELLGITTDTYTGEHTVNTRFGLLSHAGTPLHDFATIPLAVRADSPATDAFREGTTSELAVQHFLNNPDLVIGKHPKLNFNLAAGHYRHPGDTSPESALVGSILRPAHHIDTMHGLLTDALMREVVRKDLTPENSGQGYMTAVNELSPLFEPTRKPGEQHTGWQPHSENSTNPYLSRPVPLHFAIEHTLKNIFHSPYSHLGLDERRSPDSHRGYDEHLIRSIPTARFAVDPAPVNMVHHLTDPNYMVRDYQHVFRGLESKDKILSGLMNQYYRQAKNTSGSIDFEGMSPRMSTTLGKHAWSSGANQATIGALRQQLGLLNEYGVKDTKLILPGDRKFDTGTADRINRVLENRPEELDRRSFGGGGGVNDESGLRAYQEFW